MKTKLFLVFAFFLLFVCPISAQNLTLEKGVAQNKGLDEVYRQFSEGYRQLNAAMVANLYTDSAAYLAPGDNIQTGRQRILENFQGFFDSVKKQNGKLEIKFRIVQRQIDKNLAYDVGIYTLISTNEKGQSNEGSGKFVVVARKEKTGVWRFQVDGYSDLPQAKNK